MRRRVLLTGLAVLPLAGCTSLHSAASVEAGRFSLQVTKGEEAEAWSGKYRLETSTEETVFVLMTPINGILARVSITPHRATLERPQKPDISAADSAALMQDAFGFSLPIEVLRSWLAAQPAPGFEAQSQEGGFTQLGWEITPLSRAAGRAVRITHPETIDFPRVRLTLTVES